MKTKPNTPSINCSSRLLFLGLTTASSRPSCSPPPFVFLFAARTYFDPPMASVTVSSITSFSCSLRQNQAPTRISSLNSVSLPIKGKGFQSLRIRSTPSRFQVSCAAKPETVQKVCEIVRKQLALPTETAVTGESKFQALGADSLDTVEIVMGLEEEFGISVEEESAQNIATVQDAADLIEKLIEKKGA